MLLKKWLKITVISGFMFDLTYLVLIHPSQFIVDIWLVPDDTVYLSNTPPSFGTRGSLIRDISIASYSTTRFFYSFSLIYSTGKTAAGDKPGGGRPRTKHPVTSETATPRYRCLPELKRGATEKYRAYILRKPIQGFFILTFSSFCFRRGSHLPFPDRSPAFHSPDGLRQPEAPAIPDV